MTMIPVRTAGKYGINKDLSEHELPVEAWTDGLNIRFLGGLAHQAMGYSEYYTSAAVVPHHVLPVNISTAPYWIYASKEKLYCVTMTGGTPVHTNLTRQTAGNDVDYAATDNSWTSSLLSGIPILNPGNTTDPPQQWDLNTANNFAALSNWPASTYAKALRSFGPYLIAMNIKEGSDTYPFMVWWSHPADPGAVPPSWDYTSTTVEAGRYDLGDGYGQIVDGMQLRDVFMVYREKSIHRMDWIGGNNIFRFSKVLGDSGAMNRNCIVEVLGKHVVLTSSDVIMHDGFQFESILNDQWRRWLFLNIDATYNSKCFVFKNTFFNEVYICFPSVGSTVCDRAIVWNYVDRNVTIRELPNILHAAEGPIDPVDNGVWSADEDPWGVDDTLWGGPDLVPWSSRVMMGTDQKIYLLDGAYSFAGAVPTVLLERRGLSFGATNAIKLVKSIQPVIKGQEGAVINISVGSHWDINEEPVWTTKQFTIGTSVRSFFLVSGPYIAIKFENNNSYKFRLDSYQIDMEIVGEWQ